MCHKEKIWLKSDSVSHKRAFKTRYVFARKVFDKEVQRAKRYFWFTEQKIILNEVNLIDVNLWKSIGKIGINQEKRRFVPMQG